MNQDLKHKLLNSYKNEMISFMNEHPEYFDEVAELALSDNQPFSWRAAWLLSNILEPNDARIKKVISRILKSAETANDGHQRELLKIIYLIDLPDRYEGKLFNLCMNIWEQINKSASVRITALKLIVKTVKRHPELAHEISYLTQDHFLDSLSPGVRNSVTKLMKEFIH